MRAGAVLVAAPRLVGRADRRAVGSARVGRRRSLGGRLRSGGRLAVRLLAVDGTLVHAGRRPAGRGLGGRRRGRAALRPTGRGALRRAGGRGRGGDLPRRGSARDGHTALQPVEPGEHAGGRVVGGRQQDAGADQLEQQPRRRGSPHLGQPDGDEVGRPGELGAAEAVGLGHEPLGGVLADVDEAGGRGVRHGLDDHEVTQAPQEILGEATGILTGLHDPVDRAEDGRAVCRRERLHDVVEQGVGRVAEQRRRALQGHPRVARAADQLVEDRQGVARRPPAGAYHQGQRRRLDRDALGLAEVRQVVGQRARRDEAEGVVVRTRPDRADDLLGLGRREDELQVGRGLLDQLEQGVEALRGDHVGLVDDVDLVAARHRREERLLAQIPRVVDAAVARRVDLDHVDRAGAAAGQVAAGLALPARRRGGALLAVHAARHDARTRRLAAAARAGEEVGVVDPVARERRLEGLGHVVLTDDLVEGLGAVAPVQREGGIHAGDPTRGHRR